MRFDEYVEFDAVGLAALVREGEVSPGELLDAAVERADATHEAISALVHRTDDVARRRIAAGLPDGPFTGVPFLVKDLGCEAVDHPCCMGSRLFEGFRWPYDSEIFTRMSATGVVTFSRTASPEFGVGPTTEPAVHGPTRNPWHRGRVAGGSSGGSAAAVAAGVVPMAHGSDGGGSVRIPASNCGLFGLKPTRAMLPDGPEAGEGWAGMAIDGFFTRSVRDTAVMLDAVAGADLGAPYFAPRSAPAGEAQSWGFAAAITAPPRRLRVAVTTRSFTGAPVHADCVAAVEHTAEVLAALGHDVEVVDPDVPMEAFMRAWTTVVACGTQLTVEGRARALGVPADDLSDEGPLAAYAERVTRLAVAHGRTCSGADYIAALDVVHALGRRMARFLTAHDVLLSSTMGEPPAEIGRFTTERRDAWGSFLEYRLEHVLPYSPFTALANGTGQPAMNLPLWWNAAGLPVGTMVMGRAGDDAVLLQLAAQVEEAHPWFHRRPAL